MVLIAWLKDRPEAYRTLCKLWISEEFIFKSMKVREYRGTGGPPMHIYGFDGYVRTGQQMERASDRRPPDIKVWNRGYRGSDHSNPDKLCNPVVEARLKKYKE